MKTKEYKVDIVHTYVDPKYQRTIKNKWVNEIVKNYDKSKVNQIILSAHPDGRYSVIDGQHTIEATRKVIGEHAELSAKVFFDLTQEEEAELFYSYNNDRKALTSGDKIRARYAIGEPLVVSYFDTLDEAGVHWVISKKGANYGAHTLSSHATLIRVFNVVGKEIAKRAFSVAKDSNHFNTQTVAGLMFLMYKVPDIDRKRLVRKLLPVTEQEIIRLAYSLSASFGYSAATVSARSDNKIPASVRIYAKTLAVIYNKQLQYNKIDIDAI